MPRYHLRFKHFKPEVLAATTTLFESRPWDENYEEQTEKFQAWATAAAAAHDIPEPMVLVTTPEMQIAAIMDDFRPPDNALILDKFSVLTMFYKYRLWMLQNGKNQYNPSRDEDAIGWACSLFYKVRPISFRRAVRSGRVAAAVSPEDLLSSETLERVRELRLAGDFEAAEAIVAGEVSTPSALDDEDEETLTELQEAFSDEVPALDEGSVSGPWNPAEAALLGQLAAGQVTIDAVVAQTGRTKSAIRAKVRRMSQSTTE